MEYSYLVEKWAAEAVSTEKKIEGLIKDMVKAHGRDDLFREPLAGFSDASDERYEKLKDIVGPWVKSPVDLMENAKSVISYFVPFTKEVADAPKSSDVVSPLWSEAYEDINNYFEVIGDAVVELLDKLGFENMKIRATHTYDPIVLQSLWSHRSAAVIAGLAAFGANRMAITEKGSAGRYCTVITSAELKSDKAPVEDKCLYHKDGSCGLCFKACPTKALTPGGFEKFTCHDELLKNQYHIRQTTSIKSADVCGKCLSVCPLAYIE